MPVIKSAKKRVRVAKKATVRNTKTKRVLKHALKTFQKSIEGDKKQAVSLQRRAQSELDKAAKKHVLHKNKVARKQRQLAQAAKAAGISNMQTKTAAPKKPVTKTSVTKKATVKKPAAKKPTTKKST